jgi:hypothetical protein
MHVQYLIATVAALALGANACAAYVDCKCHDSKTGLQNDGITKAACEKLARDTGSSVSYLDAPHHQVRYFCPQPISTFSIYGKEEN